MTTSPFTLTTIHGLAEYHQWMHRHGVHNVWLSAVGTDEEKLHAAQGIWESGHEWYREMREKYPRPHGRGCYYCGERPVFGYRGESDIFCRPCLERYEESQYTRFRYLP